MKKRLLAFGLVAALSQLLGSGCFWISHWRANHPCGGICDHYHPLLHPVQTRRALLDHPPAGAVGPTVTNPPCHGCGMTGGPVGVYGGPSDLVPTGVPTIGYPTPIVPGGPTVVPSYELPHPMPVPKNNGGN